MFSKPVDTNMVSAMDSMSYTYVIDSSSIPMSSTPHITDVLNIVFGKIVYFIKLFIHLFFQRKFFLHRLPSLSYLLQYFFAFYLYFQNYDAFKSSILI